LVRNQTLATINIEKANAGALEKHLDSFINVNQKFQGRRWTTREDYVIKKLRQGGVPLDRIGVLLKSNKSAITKRWNELQLKK